MEDSSPARQEEELASSEAGVLAGCPKCAYVPTRRKEARQPPTQLTLICEWARLPSGLGREVQGKGEKETRERGSSGVGFSMEQR